MKLSIMYLVGITSAKYPKADPILPLASLRNISRLSNLVLLPCLIISSLGSTITVEVIGRIGIMAFFCIVVNTLSYLLTETLGYFIFGTEQGSRTSSLFISIKIAVGNPNAISLPIIVMKTMCANRLINADFDNDAGLCYNEATSMISVYVSTWFMMFWGYGFPALQSLKQQLQQQAEGKSSDIDEIPNEVSSKKDLYQQYVQPILNVFTDKTTQEYLLDKVKKIVFNPVILSVAMGLFIGLVTPLRQQLFLPDGNLFVIGSAFKTMAEAVVALNCFIMAASLAHCDFPLEQFQWVTKLDTFLFDDLYTVVPPRRPMEQTKNVVVDEQEEDVEPYKYHPVSNPILHNVATAPHPSPEEWSQISAEDIETNHHTLLSLPPAPSLNQSTPTLRRRKRSISSLRSDEEVESVISASIPADSIFPADPNPIQYHHQKEEDEDEQELAAKEEKNVPASPAVTKKAVTLPPMRAVATLVICRLILTPLVMVIINQLCLSIGLLSPSNRMMALLIILESAAPSAQVLIVTLNQLGIPEVASAMSYMYVYLYFFSIFTVTIWISVAMSLYY